MLKVLYAQEDKKVTRKKSNAIYCVQTESPKAKESTEKTSAYCDFSNEH